MESSSKKINPVILYEAIYQDQAPSVTTTTTTTRSPWYIFTLSFENARLTVPSFLIWFVSLAIHTYASKVTLHRGTLIHDLRHSPPLFDIIHDHVPSLQQYRIIPELCYLAPVLFTSALMLYHFDQRSLDCIRTFLWTHAFLLCFRALSFSSTLLPDSSQTCHTSIFTGSCYDLIYSGHVMIMFLSILLGQHFFVLHPIINAFFILDLLVTSFLVIVTRNHYTVDVVIALIMTILTFIAFTRHPPLVSLTCLIPEKILAKESKVRSCLSCCGLGRQKVKSNERNTSTSTTMTSLLSNTYTSTSTTSTPPIVLNNLNKLSYTQPTNGLTFSGQRTTGIDGYPLVSLTGGDLDQVTEHAHATLRLMGLHPHVFIFKSGQVEPAWITPLLISSHVRSSEGRINLPLSKEKLVETANKETQTEEEGEEKKEESTLSTLPIVE